jgi:cytosine/adenosine deaminase-related metal-dependent hydrolase
MVRYISADYVFPIHRAPLKNGVVALNESGEIVDLFEEKSRIVPTQSIEKYRGFLTPGFINSHCHLELSHLHKKIPQNTKLIPFIEAVMKHPANERLETEEAMKKADEQMYQSGIVAVGDIANTANSKEIKLKSKIYYHTFVEIIGFDPEKADYSFNKGKELINTFSPLSASLSPHAPYSVSKKLLHYIKSYCSDNENLISIHNQESAEENFFYQYKKGAFIDFYKRMGSNIDYFTAKSRNSIQSIISHLTKKERILFVHNTYSTYKDISSVERYGLDATWCFCPNANLYIEGTLPNIEMFLSFKLPIVLGTDSLASNNKLCILSELKTLQKNFPDLDLHQMLNWACLNGAKYLGLEKTLGSLEKGKKPGINLISHTKDMNITQESTVRKLI